MIEMMLMFFLIELYIIAACALIFVIYKLRRAYKRYRFVDVSEKIKDDDLPSVSVCLPARNETNAMTECLEAVLSSDYPKLEVIVLDDNSTDNTSHLIKAFAHAGARFIQGKKLPSDWLGKNFALETLLGEASGKYILFMDVDTVISPKTIRKLVNQAIKNDVAMVSVIPQRYDTYRASAWFATMRYLWELVLDSRDSPGSSSAAWMIKRSILRDELGGFSIWRDEVQPESRIAKEMALTNEYKLILSSPDLGVQYFKKWSSQIETGRRLLLPRFNNSIVSMLVGVSLLMSIVVPQIIILVAIVEQQWAIVVAEAVLGLVATVLFASYCRLVWLNRWWVGLVVAPYVAWQELVLLVSSIVGYQKGSITWKGRPVARPTRKRLT